MGSIPNTIQFKIQKIVYNHIDEVEFLKSAELINYSYFITCRYLSVFF